jgi:hypothetical protein
VKMDVVCKKEKGAGRREQEQTGWNVEKGF